MPEYPCELVWRQAAYPVRKLTSARLVQTRVTNGRGFVHALSEMDRPWRGKVVGLEAEWNVWPCTFSFERQGYVHG